MARGGAPPYKRRLEPVLDSHLYACVEQVNGVHDPETGRYATLIYSGCESRERAEEIKKALYRSAYHLKLSLSTKIKKRGDVWDVEYTAFNKTFGKKYVMDTYGKDRSKMPYDPRRKER